MTCYKLDGIVLVALVFSLLGCGDPVSPLLNLVHDAEDVVRTADPRFGVNLDARISKYAPTTVEECVDEICERHKRSRCSHWSTGDDVTKYGRYLGTTTIGRSYLVALAALAKGRVVLISAGDRENSLRFQAYDSTGCELWSRYWRLEGTLIENLHCDKNCVQVDRNDNIAMLFTDSVGKRIHFFKIDEHGNHLANASTVIPYEYSYILGDFAVTPRTYGFTWTSWRYDFPWQEEPLAWQIDLDGQGIALNSRQIKAVPNIKDFSLTDDGGHFWVNASGSACGENPSYSVYLTRYGNDDKMLWRRKIEGFLVVFSSRLLGREDGGVSVLLVGSNDVDICDSEYNKTQGMWLEVGPSGLIESTVWLDLADTVDRVKRGIDGKIWLNATVTATEAGFDFSSLRRLTPAKLLAEDCRGVCPIEKYYDARIKSPCEDNVVDTFSDFALAPDDPMRMYVAGTSNFYGLGGTYLRLIHHQSSFDWIRGYMLFPTAPPWECNADD